MIRANARKVFIKTFGCQMNVYDSQRMSDVLGPIGYSETDTVDDADLVILNTCHIREKAAEKVYSEIGRLRKTKNKRAGCGKDTTIAVAGCVAQAEGKEIVARAPEVDLVFGPQTYHRLPQYLDQLARGEKRLVETEFPVDDKFSLLDYGPASKQLARGVSAFVTVQEGCDKFCTFCVVPYTRGAEFSRPVMRIAKEVENLARNGVRDFTLLGQNVNAYHGEGLDGKDWDLARLLDHLSEIDGVARLRFTTSHPRDMTDALIAAYGQNPKLMPYLHLPVQSGSDTILKAMNRQHKAEEYMVLIERIRASRPDIALSGDFIVGFPGETDADFAATMDLIEQVKYAQAYSFKYSPRPGTPASEHEDQVPEAAKTERLTALQARLKDQQTQFNSACQGREFDVLLERQGRHAGQLVGRSPYLQAVHLDGKAHKIGDIVKVRVDGLTTNSLSAQIIDR